MLPKCAEWLTLKRHNKGHLADFMYASNSADSAPFAEVMHINLWRGHYVLAVTSGFFLSRRHTMKIERSRRSDLCVKVWQWFVWRTTTVEDNGLVSLIRQAVATLVSAEYLDGSLHSAYSGKALVCPKCFPSWFPHSVEALGVPYRSVAPESVKSSISVLVNEVFKTL